MAMILYFKGEYPINSDGYTGLLDGADIHITGNGRYLYASNRGNNTIVCFSVAEDGNKYGGKVYDTAEELLADPDIDAVSVCAANYAHAELDRGDG